MEPSHLKIEHHRSAGGVVLLLSGVIDETLDKARLSEGSDGVVVLDLEGVTRITSYGVLSWKGALSMMSAQYIGFVNCHPSIVSQFNMVHGFAGRGQLVSLYLPYACASCQHTFERLFDLRQRPPEIGAADPPAARCPNCGGAAAFDDLPDSYFAYAVGQPPPEPPPLFDVLLAGARGNVAMGLRVLKEVEGRFTAVRLSGELDGRDHLKRAADDIEGPLLLSLDAVSRFVPEGLGRVIDFAKRAPAEVVISGAPLELLGRIAAEPELMRGGKVKLLTLRAPFRCETHGEVQVPFEARTFVETRPAQVPCPTCGRAASSAGSAAALAAGVEVPTAERTSELEAVLARGDGAANDPGAAQPGAAKFGAGALGLGAYQQVRALGAGRVAEVFLARHTGGSVEKLVVVKRVLPGIAVDRSFVELFLQEARRAARLSHPNVVEIHEVGCEGEQYFIVMEHVPGPDLAALMRRAAAVGPACPVPVAVRIVADLAAGLAAAHAGVDADKGRREPLVHRDVSPHNVLVSREGLVKVTDFGIARAAEVMTQTPTSVLKGNAPYVAPELVRGGGPAAVSVQADVFGAGLILYELLTGEHPFKRDSELSTFAALVEEEAPPPSARRREVPAALDALVARAIAKEPAARHAGAGELAAALEQLLAQTASRVDAAQVASWVRALEPGEAGAAHASAPEPALKVVGKA